MHIYYTHTHIWIHYFYFTLTAISFNPTLGKEWCLCNREISLAGAPAGDGTWHYCFFRAMVTHMRSQSWHCKVHCLTWQETNKPVSDKTDPQALSTQK